MQIAEQDVKSMDTICVRVVDGVSYFRIVALTYTGELFEREFYANDAGPLKCSEWRNVERPPLPMADPVPPYTAPDNVVEIA